jgi:hypothetical protein
MKKIAYINPNACDRSPGCPAIRVCPAQAISHQRTGMFSYAASVVDPQSLHRMRKMSIQLSGWSH